MSKLCQRCHGTGLEPGEKTFFDTEPNGVPILDDPKGRASNTYQDLLTGPMGRVFHPGDLSDTEGYDDDK